MTQAAPTDDDELAGAEQPFMAHLLELRTRLLRSIYGVALVTIALAVYPGPARLLDFVAQPIRAHLPPNTRLIAVDVFSPFIMPLKVLLLVGVIVAMPWVVYQIWAFVAPGLYRHEKRLALPLIVSGSLLAYTGIAFVQFLVLDRVFAFIQKFSPEAVRRHARRGLICANAAVDVSGFCSGISGTNHRDSAGAIRHCVDRKTARVSPLFHRDRLCHRCHRDPTRRALATGAGHSDVPAVRSRSAGGQMVRQRCPCRA